MLKVFSLGREGKREGIAIYKGELKKYDYKERSGQDE